MDQIISSSGESVKVFVRVRPPDPNLESGLGHGVCLDVTSDSTLMVYSKPDPKVFTFDHVASRNITQEDVFSSIGRPIIDSCMHGYNGTIFAYGQTGSGKTFTMIGPPSEESVDTFTHELRGIIPRSFEYLFSFINRNKQKYGELVEFLCKCSFLEIYNEQVFDLLDPASVGLHLRENMKHGVYVDGLTEISVSSARDSYQVLSTGWVNRKVASTSMNRESSRSHAVFTLSIESKKREVKDAVAKIRTSVLNLVDLAGSERQRDTHAAGLRLKEAGSINKSLSALGNVIMALVDIANGKSRHVHYRDSKLTFLLRDSLGGNAKTNLVANVHPSARCFGESLSTLNFARRAKMIRNKAVINEDSSGNVLQLQTEIKRLRSFIERYKAGLPPDLKNSLFSSPSPISSDTQADETVTIMELKNMLTSSMEARDRANVEKTDMCSRVERLKELNERKDKFLQSTKMILKFRESHISNLEKARKTETQAISESAQEETNKLLREEIQQLKYLMEHHPEKIRMMHENLGLKAEIKKLQSSAGIKGESSQLARSHHYTLQLEKQLRHYLARNGTSSPMAGCQAPNTPTKTTFDLEGLQARCKQLKEELDAARISLNRERETSHLRVSIVETSLTAAKKANVELERSIEALKLKNNVEKATLNDIHMTTIKMILTPKRDRNQLIRNKSYSCTPNSFTRHDSLPFPDHSLSSRHSIIAVSPTSKFSVILENEKRKIVGRGRSLDLSPDTSPNYTNDSTTNHTPGSTPCAKKAKFSKSAVVSSSCDDDALMSAMPLFSLNDDVNEDEKGLGMVADVASEEGEAEELDEVQIQGALTEELKRLQDRNRSLQQELEELEASVVHLSHGKSALEAQLEEVTQLSKFDREGYYEKEQGYLEKVSDMASQIAHLKSTYGVMESEVQDLRVCLKSADKELKEVKEEKRDEKRSHDGKISTYIHRITELESLYSMEESKYNRAVEELQNLQVEVDTLREEMTFKEHRLCELEDALRREKALVSSQEGEIQNLLDKLALEVEGTTRLSLELQEGHNGKKELVKTINENHHLHSEVEQLEGELQSHLQTHKQQMEKTELSLNTLLKQKSTDEAAIAGFVATIQELRGENTRDECRLLGLERELEESGKELSAAVSKNDTMRGEVIRLQEELCENATTYGRELSKKEAEREIVCEDLDRLNDQYQQLNMEFEEQARKMTSAHGDLEEARRELGSSEGEVKRLLHKMDRSSLSKRLSTDEEITEVSSEEEIEQLKWQLDQAATMIQSYEMSREEKNSDISRLKDHVLALERLEDKHVSQQGVIAELHYELSQKEEKVNVLGSQCQAAAAEVERMMKESRLIAAEKTRLLSENAELLLKCGQQTEQVTALTEQIERYKTSEESLFQEKEAVRSQLEMFHEEKAKLSKECEKLVKENAAITGHQNIRQKIQYHAAVKIENQKLKEEVIQLHSRLKWKTEQVDKLQSILTENGLESKHSSNTKRTTHNDPPQVNFKENIVLK